MTDENPYEFAFEKGPYIFAFRKEDDFSQVKIVNLNGDASTWELNQEFAFVGENCIAFHAGPDRNGDAWLFSRGFEFKRGQRYEAGIYYAARGEDGGAPLLGPEVGGEVEGSEGRVPIDRQNPRHPTNAHKLRLRLGRAQEPEAMATSLVELGIANVQYQVVKVGFEVPEDNVYYFSLQARSLPNSGWILVGQNGAGFEGSLEAF